jgi:hypothetical protein
MAPRAAFPSWFRRRLAWRLCALFVVGALVPVALSDWLVITVMNGLAERMDSDKRVQAVRATSRQVLERVRLGQMLLQARADAYPAAPAASLPAFDRVSCAPAGAPTPPADPADAALVDTWRHVYTGTARPGEARLAVAPGVPARVLAAVGSTAGTACVGQFADAFLWEPLRNGADDAAWTVRDATRQIVAEARGADVPEDPQRAGPQRLHAARLFMGPAGANLEWTFEQTTPRARVDWHDRPAP